MVSLLYTIQALDKTRFTPIVGLVFPDDKLAEYYRRHGIQVVNASKLALFHHTTARWARLGRPRTFVEFFQNILKWRKIPIIIENLKRENNVDIFHLNSVVLAPVAKVLLETQTTPFIWHVRESPASGYFGFRRRFLSRLLQRAGHRVIFLSKADKTAWLGGKCGTVVNNFLELSQFDRNRRSGESEFLPLELDESPKILYVGGFSKIKGAMVLLQALKILKESNYKFQCVFPGTTERIGGSQSLKLGLLKKVAFTFGYKPFHAKCLETIEKFGLSSFIHQIPFTNAMPKLLSFSNCLVFPSIEPHFARPVIEAQVMGVPVVASEIDGVSELLVDPSAGCLVPPGDPFRLADALKEVLSSNKVGKNNKFVIEKARSAYGSVHQIKKIEDLYEEVCGTF